MNSANTKIKNSRPSFFRRRKEIRFELLQSRIKDKDNTEARLCMDATKLDSKLVSEGYKLEYQTEWARTRAVKCPHYAQQADMADFNKMEVIDGIRSYI